MSKIILIFSLSLVTILHAIEIKDDGILFEYYDENAQSVFLVGSMNDWDVSKTPMEKDDDGVWRIFLELDYGKYLYKFMVDGNWQVDHENPNFEDDGYGGSNSVVEFSDKLNASSSAINDNYKGVNSQFNPKVYFKGRYLSDNVFYGNSTESFMLDKPTHDLNLGIKIKFNSDFEGYTILNVNNNKEETEMWKTHFNYQRSYLKLNTDYFSVMAFDNFDLISFDNPLHTVGGIGYNSYNFGYGFSGLHAKLSNFLSDMISSFSPLSIDGELLLSDRIAYNEDDVSAGRIKLSIPIFSNDVLRLGASNYKYTTKPSDALIQYHENFGFDFNYLKNISKESWNSPMEFELSGEFSKYENTDDSGVESIWMEGQNMYLGASIKFPASLKIHASYINTSFDLGTKFSRDRFALMVSYRLKNFKWGISGEFWKNNNLDNLNWGDYYKYVEKSDGNGRWFQEYTEVPFEKYTILGYKTGFSWVSSIDYIFNINNHKFQTALTNKFAHHSFHVEPKFIENIFKLTYHISNNWKFKIDSRMPYYNDSFLGLKTNFSDGEDVFLSAYTEIAYYLSNNVWLAVGYGVNPLVMNTVTNKFHNRGREEYLNEVGGLSDYLDSYYGGLGDKIREAETSLMNDKRISVRAILEF